MVAENLSGKQKYSVKIVLILKAIRKKVAECQ